jgi:DNA-binding Xre family transcriptional regulator
MTRLKKVLNDKNISQKQLAKMSEVAEYKISQLCMGKSKDLFLSTAKRICEVLNVSLDDAFGDVIK